MPRLNILKRNGETTREAVRRRMLGYDPPPLTVRDKREAVKEAVRLLRGARA